MLEGTPTPGPSPTPTRTPTVTPTPYPRPNVGVLIVPDTGSRLRVTIRARDAACGPNNHLFELRFGAATNALVDLGDGLPRPSGFIHNLPLGTQLFTFYVHRETPGAAATLSLLAVDGCGAWPTFVRGGAGAF